MKTQKEMNISNSGKFEKSVPDNPCDYIDAIHSVMRELGCWRFVDVLKAYFTARIVLAYERGAGYMETMITSPVLQKTLYAFKEAKPDQNKSEENKSEQDKTEQDKGTTDANSNKKEDENNKKTETKPGITSPIKKPAKKPGGKKSLNKSKSFHF